MDTQVVKSLTGRVALASHPPTSSAVPEEEPREPVTRPEPVRLVVADDQRVVLQALELLLDTEPDLEVVGTAADGLEVPGMVSGLAPDVLVVDYAMPGLDGLEITRKVTRRRPDTRVVILSTLTQERHVAEALRAGALGYVLKKSHAGELLEAVRQASRGQHYLSRPYSDRGLSVFLEMARHPAEDPYDSLTEREREVFHLVAEGHTSVEIAKRLFISPRTVESHRASMFRKLNLKGQSDLVRFAVRRGLLALDGENE